MKNQVIQLVFGTGKVQIHRAAGCVMAVMPLAALLLAASIGTQRAAGAEDWPQFRGPNSSGISNGDRRLPVKFSATDNVRWSADLGEGVGGAVVVAGRVFVTAMTQPQTVSLFAFDAASGDKLWQRDWATGPLAEIHRISSPASATPAADNERVYFYFSTLGLIAVDAESGKDVWHRKLPTPFFIFKWGPGVSPVLYRDLVLFCQDDDLNPALYAIDRASGELRWKDERRDMAVNYSHPVISSTEGRDEIVVAGTGLLIGYDPDSGARRWFARVLIRNIKTTPVCRDGVIYVSVQSGGIANQWLVAVDAAETGNKDQRIDRAEIQAFVGDQPIPPAFLDRAFERGDLDQDGFLAGRELDLAFLHPDNFAGASYESLGDNAAEQYVLAVRGGGRGDVTTSHLLWKHKTSQTDHIVSPYVADGRMLLVKEGSISTVFETTGGQLIGGPKRIGPGGSYYASPVAGDGKIYIAGENGVVVVLQDSPRYEELSRNDMGDSIMATPAIADGALFIRTRSKLLCVSDPAP